MLRFSGSSQNPCSSVLDELQLFNGLLWKAGLETIAIIHPAGDKGMNTARIALAHQLPRVAGSANCLAEVQPAAWLARVGLHDLIVRFVRGARRLNPPRPPLVPSWDLPIVLAGLQRGPFEPLDSVELKFLSAKTALLTALTSIKRVGDLRAFSVSEEWLVFGPAY